MVKKNKKSFFEKVETEILNEAGSYINYKTDVIKKKAFHIGEISVLALIGFFLICLGLATLLGTYFTVLSNGLNYLIIGIILIIVSLSVKI